VVVALLLGSGAYVFATGKIDTPTTTTSTTTTTTVPPEQPQAGWAVVSRSSRGVMSDLRTITEGGAAITVVRFRARTVAFRWHVGLEDPPGATSKVGLDSQPHIDTVSESAIGVIGAFNGGFKVDSHSGGSMTDGVVLEPMVAGRATVAISTSGALTIGQWGLDLPRASFPAIAYRQNSSPLIWHGALSPALSTWGAWGDTLHGVPAVSRTALGIDAQGNVLYGASETGILPIQLARALLAAGAVNAMELDINPYWPVLGLVHHPSHSATTPFELSLPHSQHSASIYWNGWTRDFFVALAQPDAWTCNISIAATGLTRRAVLKGTNCSSTTTTTTTTSTSSTTAP
jgi:hypothetical protein